MQIVVTWGSDVTSFVPGDQALVFPAGTIVAYMCPTWGMYVNHALNRTWIGYAAPGGTRITALPGIRTQLSTDFKNIEKFVSQRQTTACGQCGG